jgi:peptidoglycan/xylan/chitin deacetylase (PgdA/CDA1 family)
MRSRGELIRACASRGELIRACASRDHLTVIRHLLAPVVPPAAGALMLPRRLAPGTRGVAITFDDGPHPEGTPAVLELLAQAGARATFFMIGEQVSARPELAGEIAAAGHCIALHGHRHRLQLRFGRGGVEEDLRRGADAIAQATGVEPVWHRPPYGIYSPDGLRAARRSGLKPLLWSQWGRDWRKFTTPQRIYARVTDRLAPGDVILLHDADFYSAKDSHRRTAAALSLILAELRRREIGTVLPV